TLLEEDGELSGELLLTLAREDDAGELTAIADLVEPAQRAAERRRGAGGQYEVPGAGDRPSRATGLLALHEEGGALDRRDDVEIGVALEGLEQPEQLRLNGVLVDRGGELDPWTRLELVLALVGSFVPRCGAAGDDTEEREGSERSKGKRFHDINSQAGQE